MQQSNPKMLRACYKDAVRNPLVANAGLIHKRGECGPVLCAFSVGGAAASCQLPIIGRQRRRTAGTRRVVARPTGRKRNGSTRTWTDTRSRNANRKSAVEGKNVAGRVEWGGC